MLPLLHASRVLYPCFEIVNPTIDIQNQAGLDDSQWVNSILQLTTAVCHIGHKSIAILIEKDDTAAAAAITTTGVFRTRCRVQLMAVRCDYQPWPLVEIEPYNVRCCSMVFVSPICGPYPCVSLSVCLSVCMCMLVSFFRFIYVVCLVGCCLFLEVYISLYAFVC